MFKLDGTEKMNDKQRMDYLLILIEGQLSSEKDAIANLSNASAFIKALLDNLNWAGFYILKDDELVLGPFQGLPACNRIKLGNGVCGTAAKERKTIIVPNVHEFLGHIACDGASNSEIVVPIIKDNVVYGVLDIDSPLFNRFNDLEEKYLEKFIEKLNKYIDWNIICKI